MIQGQIVSECCHAPIDVDENGDWYCMECGAIVKPKKKDEKNRKKRLD